MPNEDKPRTSRDVVDEIYAIAKKLRDSPPKGINPLEEVREEGNRILLKCMELHTMLSGKDT